MADENTVGEKVAVLDVPPKKLKRLDVLNDYIAVLVKPLNTDVAMSEESKDKFANEGIAVGIGPEVNRGVADDVAIQLGDRLVVRGNKYMKIEPKSGVYADQTIMMVHKPDLVLRHSRAKIDEFAFGDWTEEDTTVTRNENQ